MPLTCKYGLEYGPLQRIQSPPCELRSLQERSGPGRGYYCAVQYVLVDPGGEGESHAENADSVATIRRGLCVSGETRIRRPFGLPSAGASAFEGASPGNGGKEDARLEWDVTAT